MKLFIVLMCHKVWVERAKNIAILTTFDHTIGLTDNQFLKGSVLNEENSWPRWSNSPWKRFYNNNSMKNFLGMMVRLMWEARRKNVLLRTFVQFLATETQKLMKLQSVLKSRSTYKWCVYALFFDTQNFIGFGLGARLAFRGHAPPPHHLATPLVEEEEMKLWEYKYFARFARVCRLDSQCRYYIKSTEILVTWRGILDLVLCGNPLHTHTQPTSQTQQILSHTITIREIYDAIQVIGFSTPNPIQFIDSRRDCFSGSLNIFLF